MKPLAAISMIISCLFGVQAHSDEMGWLPHHGPVKSVELYIYQAEAKNVLLEFQDGALFYSKLGDNVRMTRLARGTQTNQALSRSEKASVPIRKFRSKIEDNSDHLQCEIIGRREEIPGPVPGVKNYRYGPTGAFEECKGHALLFKKGANVLAEIEAAAGSAKPTAQR